MPLIYNLCRLAFSTCPDCLFVCRTVSLYYLFQIRNLRATPYKTSIHLTWSVIYRRVSIDPPSGDQPNVVRRGATKSSDAWLDRFGHSETKATGPSVSEGGKQMSLVDWPQLSDAPFTTAARHTSEARANWSSVTGRSASLQTQRHLRHQMAWPRREVIETRHSSLQGAQERRQRQGSLDTVTTSSERQIVVLGLAEEKTVEPEGGLRKRRQAEEDETTDITALVRLRTRLKAR
ncbi:unnamed protein product [Protopolystoma xenopodis]|uniref:Uncharacterized protein n=1 Tax=Protopolystoma xenopodis TaxID=117903 RepID=A0A448X3V2_9PLAT|nr:unnamed protein product [Protopolystoma xenopodis]